MWNSAQHHILNLVAYEPGKPVEEQREGWRFFLVRGGAGG